MAPRFAAWLRNLTGHRAFAPAAIDPTATLRRSSKD